MVAAGVELTESSYACLIRGSASCNDVPSVLKYFAQLQSCTAHARTRWFTPVLAMFARVARGDVVTATCTPAAAADHLDAFFADLQRTGVEVIEADFTAVIAGYGGVGLGARVLSAVLPLMANSVFSVSSDAVALLRKFFEE